MIKSIPPFHLHIPYLKKEADFAYLLFFDSGGMSLMNFVFVRDVWCTKISRLNNVISR